MPLALRLQKLPPQCQPDLSAHAATWTGRPVAPSASSAVRLQIRELAFGDIPGVTKTDW